MPPTPPPPHDRQWQSHLVLEKTTAHYTPGIWRWKSVTGKRVSVKLVGTVAESESIPEGNEEAGGVSLDEGGVGGQREVWHRDFAAKKNLFSFCSTWQSCLSRGWPSSTLPSLRLITLGLWSLQWGRHVLRDTREECDSRQKKTTTMILLYKKS